jgi:hypothetical protein
MVIDEGIVVTGFGQAIINDAPVTVAMTLPAEDSWTLAIPMFGQATALGPPHIDIRLDGAIIASFDVEGAQEEPFIFKHTTTLPEGEHLVEITLTNPNFAYERFGGGRYVAIDYVSWTASAIVTNEPDLRPAIVLCEPPESDGETCLRKNLEQFLPRAWRRPVAEEEVVQMVALGMASLDEGDSFDAAMAQVLQAALLSPYFIFMVESGESAPATAEAGGVGGYILANRLSYFVWGSMPDALLMEAAKSGALLESGALQAQFIRMLNDPRSDYIMEGLGSHWLGLSRAKQARPNSELFPEVDDELRSAAVEEIRLFLRSMLQNDRTLPEFIHTSELVINGDLAKHYGIDGVEGGFTHLSDNSEGRGGLLRMAGILAGLSHPSRTSPVRRGKWIYENLLCGQVDVPASIPALPDIDPKLKKPAKDELSMHVEDPACAGCHLLMDPLGLALERYDASGAWRDVEYGLPIDPSGTLPGGASFTDEAGMITELAKDPRFTQCVVRRVLTFALGRILLPEEEGAVLQLVSLSAGDGHHLKALLGHIVAHPLFRKRVGTPLPDNGEDTP